MQTSTPHLSLKEKQHQEREALILQIAEEVLLEKGYHETSMDEIAARVGVAKGTLYRHFPGKEDLVVAIFVHDHQQFTRAVDAALAMETSVGAKLEAFLRFMYGGFFSKRTQLLYTIQNSFDLQRLFAEKGNHVRELWEGVAARITALVEEGKAAGELDTSVPTKVMVNAFFGLLSPKNYARLIVEEDMSPAELASYLTRIYLNGVGLK